MRTAILAILVLIIPAIPQAQTDQAESPLKAIRFLEGSWEGTGEGFSGKSAVTQDYDFILNDTYLQMKTRSVFEPQEKNPKGEVHEDMGVFSFDEARQAIVLRAFYVEGFVNTYVLSEVSEDGKILTFETESVENAPAGTKARLVFTRMGESELEQQFFVAFPGKELSCFSTNRLKKKS